MISLCCLAILMNTFQIKNKMRFYYKEVDGLFQIIEDSSYLGKKRKRKVAIYGTEIEVNNFVFPFALENDDPKELDFETKEEMLDFLQYFKDCILFDASIK